MTQQENNPMLAQVYSLPDMIRTEFETLDHRVRLLMNHEECLAVKRIIITGCGDSHMAGVAAELAFEQIAGIATEPMRANEAGRYASPYARSDIPNNPLVLGISVSGGVARTREAVQLFRKQKLPTVGITGNPDSPLANEADKVLDCTIPEFEFAPGVRSYRMSLLALYLLAIRLGEVQDRYSQAEAKQWRQKLLATADAIEATIAAVDDKTRALAATLAGEKHYVFVGDGPNFATAMFGAAKVIEAAGVHAMGQESEEWAHLQYFTAIENQTPTFVISPGYRGHNRVGELMEPLQRIGRTSIAIVPQGDDIVGPHATHVLPVTGDIPEAFTPMVYAVATELFAAHLADAMGEPFFRREHAAYAAGNDIRVTKIVTDIEP